ncbi:N-6 DNA methylase [Aminipila butyrica]|uniref:site-specific DNA-methyltransferase (adenine-specific) n=1 Tax=Aminipila butyrica TaxID=433296 RepID=A0A858BXU3_9FIRM|nr:N-6 DNA methylase [Aminipila butyrica]QIB70009.1 N-6 DNA methylase [Aminipila butyrica]
MNNRELVNSLWNLCHVLRDDGITYHQYVTELTYLLFLKLAKETGAEEAIPAVYRWDQLVSQKTGELKVFYYRLLTALGTGENERIRQIYEGARSSIEEEANLSKIVYQMDCLDWYSAKEEGLGQLYEGLLEKNAGEKKSGAGQYFTPRVLIDVLIQLTDPQLGERCCDPACGTFGFMTAAHRYIEEQNGGLTGMTREQQEFQKKEAFTGGELVRDTHRLALMNAALHQLDSAVQLGDTLSLMGQSMKGYDVVLTNPPFGSKKGGERSARTDLTYPTGNKQLDFLQHIYGSLRWDKETARAAVVLPDNVLFADAYGELIRRELMETCNLHTILRLPVGIFYAQGVKTNVLFFQRGKKDCQKTQEVWIYDLRQNMPAFNKSNPLKKEYFEDFIQCYCSGHMGDRQETYSRENPRGRWRKYSYEEILQRPRVNLDITWIADSKDMEEESLSNLLGEMEAAAGQMNVAIAALKELMAEVEEQI